ncbi:MAG: tryptophan 7-halogenase [Moraxellaceae bacterium]|nr:tryptophan 7-halogenase [Moraxellaceae bacterium]
MNQTILVIGAGPAGATASALLRQRGYRVIVIEKQHFPRFSIGESLLPQCMEILEEAGMLETVKANADRLSFQFKNGAAFKQGERYTDFNFGEKFTPGLGWTWQVRRGDFDKLLADSAAAQGTEIRYGHEILTVDISGDTPVVTIRGEDGTSYTETPSFVLDASGFGRILPRLLNLEVPSNFPVRRAIFTHVMDHISDPVFDREKIRVTVHPEENHVWWWLIPFSDGRASVGVVACEEFFAKYQGTSEERWRAILAEDEGLSTLLAQSTVCQEVRELGGYSADVKSLYGRHFALLGNAGEFLDPVFSSGVTIAMKSASLCVPLLDRQLQGETIDWENDYEKTLRRGITVFRAYVEAWYDGSFQDIIFSPKQSPEIKAMICSLLAGYAWDEKNPFNRDAKRRLSTITEICRDTSIETDALLTMEGTTP